MKQGVPEVDRSAPVLRIVHAVMVCVNALCSPTGTVYISTRSMKGVDERRNYGKKTVNTRLTGADLAFGKIRNHFPQPGGRFLNILDEKLRRRVIFLGYELAGDLFGEEDPVGRTVLVNNVPYLIVGVMDEPNRESYPQLPPPGLGQQSATHAGSQQVRLTLDSAR